MKIKERQYSPSDLTFFLGAHLQNRYKHAHNKPFFNSERAFEFDNGNGRYVCRFLPEGECLYASIEARSSLVSKVGDSEILSVLRNDLANYSFLELPKIYRQGNNIAEIKIRVNKIPLAKGGHVSGNLFSAVGNLLQDIMKLFGQNKNSLDGK